MDRVEYRPFALPRSVEVEHDGSWYPGELRAWARWETLTWVGYVCYAVAPGMRYLEWVSTERLRKGITRG